MKKKKFTALKHENQSLTSSSHHFLSLLSSLITKIILIRKIKVFLLTEVQSTTFKIVNKCRHTVWPGILTGADRAHVNPNGFILKSGKSKTLKMPRAWWGRILCSNDPSTGKFTCHRRLRIRKDGMCRRWCYTAGEFTLNGHQGLDFYDVSLVDGYNLPRLIVAKGGTRGGCSPTGCLVDWNGACPRDLRVASDSDSVGCKSACLGV